jgi:hypothetical protein
MSVLLRQGRGLRPAWELGSAKGYFANQLILFDFEQFLPSEWGNVYEEETHKL